MFARRLAKDGHDLIIVGRREHRLAELVAEFPSISVRAVVADLGTYSGVATVAELCAREPITLLINNAGVAHYMAFAQLPADKASELLHVKVLAPTMLARAVVPGMIERQDGTIINVAGMLAFGGPAPLGRSPGRATYVATLAYIVALSQALHEEVKGDGLRVQALCPEDVVSASLVGLALDEVVCAPGLERADLLATVFDADLAAFHAQAPQLATRYRTS